MMRKVIKPVAGGYFKEVWEHQGQGDGQRRAARKAPMKVDTATGARVSYRRTRSHK
jgi:hypothetical protein